MVNLSISQGAAFLATHWRTFILSPRDQLPTFEPMQRLRQAAGDQADKIICDEPGQHFHCRTEFRKDAYQ